MRLKSKFESSRNGGRFSEPISPAVELHILSTLKTGLLQGVQASGTLPFWNSFVGTNPPPRFPAHKLRTLKSLSPPLHTWARCRVAPSRLLTERFLLQLASRVHGVLRGVERLGYAREAPTCWVTRDPDRGASFLRARRRTS